MWPEVRGQRRVWSDSADAILSLKWKRKEHTRLLWRVTARDGGSERNLAINHIFCPSFLYILKADILTRICISPITYSNKIDE